jgi:predicted ATPase
VTASLVSPVLVGRQAEFAVLVGGLQRAIAGEPTAIVVGGEAGVGKSRLVQELSERAGEAGARVLVGGCVEFGGEGIPFGPLVEVLRSLASELGIDELGERLGPARERSRDCSPSSTPVTGCAPPMKVHHGCQS